MIVTGTTMAIGMFGLGFCKGSGNGNDDGNGNGNSNGNGNGNGKPVDCGPRPLINFGRLGHYWFQQSTGRLGWIPGDLPKIEPLFPPGAKSVGRGGFTGEFLGWLRCRRNAGLL